MTKGSTNETTVSITDDDVPSVTVSFEQDSYTVAEGNSVTVKVKLSADPERTVTIPITKTNQGGASISDYSVPEQRRVQQRRYGEDVRLSKQPRTRGGRR